MAGRQAPEPTGPAGPAGARMRLNRFLALCGVASRRGAMEIVFAGRVRINERAVTDPGETVVIGRDRVTLDGERLRPPTRWSYFAFHKPRGVIVTAHDEQGRASLAPLLQRLPAHVRPVGRLDRGSEGLLLLTDHGDLANRLLHPRSGIEKVYRVRVMPCPRRGQIAQLERGVPLGQGEWSGPARVRIKRALRRAAVLSVTISEGKKREVRRMCRSVGLRVMRLRRVAFAGLRLDDLAPGAVRPLEPQEIEHLLRVTRLAP